jgi:DNA topoisomerase IA
MSKRLCVIEAPGKVSTIEKHLSQLGFHAKVFATGGRLYDLPEQEMGFSLDKLSEITLVPLKPSLIAKLEKLIDSHDEVYLMTDDDFEGELIAFHVQALCDKKPTVRLLCQSLTLSGVKQALANPTVVNPLKSQGAMNRRVFDRICGFYLSSWTSKNSYENGTVGRILSPLLNFIRTSKSRPNSITEIALQSADGPVTLRIEKSPHANLDEKSIRIISQNLYDASMTVKSEALSRPLIEPLSGQEALVFFAERTNCSIRQAADSLQSLYEQGKISYARTETKVLSAAAVNTITGVAIACGDSVGQYKENSAQKITTHDGLHVTDRIAALDGDYDRMHLEDKIWTLLYRNNLSCLKDLVLTERTYEVSSPVIDDLKRIEGVTITAFSRSVTERGFRRSYHFDPQAGLCPELARGWFCSPSVDRFVAKILCDLGLGRPSTIPYHSYKISDQYLNRVGELNFLGHSSINKAIESVPLIMSIERIHEVDRILLAGKDIDKSVYESFKEVGITKDYLAKKTVGQLGVKNQYTSEFNID